MIDFYSEIDDNTYAAALQTSKRKMIQSEDFAEPYYWAPFILIGK